MGILQSWRVLHLSRAFCEVWEAVYITAVLNQVIFATYAVDCVDNSLVGTFYMDSMFEGDLWLLVNTVNGNTKFCVT